MAEPGREAQHTLFEPLAAVGPVKGDADADRVPFLSEGLHIRLLHDERSRCSHATDATSASWSRSPTRVVLAKRLTKQRPEGLCFELAYS